MTASPHHDKVHQTRKGRTAMVTIPNWLRKYMKNSDLDRIRCVVEEVEKRTDAELVPLIVHASLDLMLMRVLFGSLGFAAGLLLSPFLERTLASSWAWGTPLVPVEVLSFTLTLLLGLLGWSLANHTPLVRWIFDRSTLQAAVFRRACGEFFENRLHHTDSRAAVLFMYSVLEKKAMIIADPHLRDVPQDIWNQAIDKMIESAKQKDFTDGFEKAFRHCAGELGQKYPPTPNKKNEFEDHLLIKE